MSASRSMKDSGLNWLGMIPESWEIKPLFTVCDELNNKNKGMKESNLLSLSYGNIVLKDIDSNEGLLPESFEGYQIVEPNDLVFRFTDLQNDQRSLRSAISQHSGIITSAYLAVRPFGANPHFLAYLMRAYDQLKVFYSMGGGLRQAMNFQDVRRLPLPIPAPKEQEEIVKFLDRETAQLDDLISKQQLLIDTLIERRSSLISRAVTYGLSSESSYQITDSITWPEIPGSWKVIALKHVLEIPMTDGPHETPEFLDEGVEFISAEAVSQGVINFEKKRGYISESDHARYSRKYFPKLHDIYVIKSGATTGRSAILTEERDFNIWSPLAVVRASPEIDPFFLHFVIQSEPFQKAIELSWTFGTQQNIGMGVLQNLQIPLPPHHEQIQIREHILFETKNIDSLIEKSKSMIEIIWERRQALISAAISGKIDVRGN